MIAAGLALAAIGGADLARVVARRAWRVTIVLVAAVVVFVLGAAVEAAGWALLAVAVAAVWWVVMPRTRPSLWPVAVLGVFVAVAGAVLGPRDDIAVFGVEVALPGRTSVDTAVLVAGAALFLCESANVVVRAALRSEAVRAGAGGGLKGGRLIGPLERLLVFFLSLSGAATLLAAVLAAKGIVRFPEISRDAGEGDRAEYFLVGTLVSWTLGVAAALLVGWAAAPR